jgi:tRNA-guanine family transglycosylase
MRWDGPILTDSGGFQVMSLSKIAKVTEEAVTFQSHIDGSRHALSPERSIEIQADLLGSDIVMQLDECVAWPAEEARARRGHGLSARWGARCKAAFGERETPGPVRHPAGLDLRGPAPRIVRAADRDRLRRLRHRRPGGGRGACRRCARCWTTRRPCCPPIGRAI